MVLLQAKILQVAAKCMHDSDDDSVQYMAIILHTVLSFIVSFLRHHNPSLSIINSVGLSWIFLSWNCSSVKDNIFSYEVKYSYIGECTGIGREIHTRTISGNVASYNITDLPGEYFSYSINLTAINNMGRSPLNVAYATTKAAGIVRMHNEYKLI